MVFGNRFDVSRHLAEWDASWEGMRITDASGTILLVNPAFCEMVGMARNQLIGRSLTCVYAASLREQVLSNYRVRFQARLDARLRRHLVLWDGRAIWFHASVAILDCDAPIALTVFHESAQRQLPDLGFGMECARLADAVASLTQPDGQPARA